ncbi:MULTISPECIES: SpoIIE family protein phosphatase [unclassified Streptomyces]|uniref:SpoIIE family protein phosphatase n=1 Tax=unclassified Streptomyces TaxID=2593676 RepID=UPI002DD918A3|nr:SpoIIE family protein phosphatase [Streptomyces sp. NBC_01750]WSA98472.1 SpoIIE family protein phosphatase [Streptomyces sp. NBC_01794]WSD36992.1 SpoIIE family protein phosphatase [Streptomyces sp. NBC_01750]
MDTPMTTFSEGPEDPFAVRRAASAVLDDRGTVIGWSERAEALLGYPPKEALGRTALGFLIDVHDDDVVMDALAVCVRDRGWFGVVPVRHRDGRRVELGCRARAITRGDAVREWFLVAAPAEEVIQWERDRSVLDGLFRRSPIGLSVFAPDLSLLRVNRAISKFSQIPVEQHRGLRVSDFLIQRDSDTVVRQLGEVLETGRSSIFTEQPCALRRDPGHEMFVSISAFRIEDPSGHILGVTQTVEDVTERYRARHRLALLNEASARIGTTLDVARTANELAEVAVPDLADCVSVDLLEPVARGEEPIQEVLGTVRRTAIRSVLPDTPQVMYPVGRTIHIPPESLQARCLAQRRPVLDTRQEGVTGWLPEDPERAERVLSLGNPSLMVVPLVARGLVLGLLSLWRWQRSEPFEDDDLTLAAEFASRAAVCIDNARRYTQQHDAALTLQHSLLPHEVPAHPAVEIAHRYLPADDTTGVGGDWFDVIPLSGLRVALVVGDVVGRGIHAAATMGRLRTAVHTLANLDLTPDEVLSRLDDLVDRLAAEQEPTDERFPQIIGATCLYAVYDPVSRQCALARAGHPPPVMVTPDGQVHLVDLPAGPPLGLGGLPFEAAELELAEGSLLALYTDGLIQARKRDVDESLADLCQALSVPTRSLEETCGVVGDALLHDRPTDDVADDVALLIARTRVLPKEKVATWELPVEPTAAAQARELAGSQLTEWGLEEMIFTTELIVSELVTNAYRYGGGPIGLRLIRDSHLICEVSDTSSTSPHLRRARTTDEGGRGLFLVAQLTERWGTRYTRDGKTIWTEQPLPATSAE